jgi:hypothetical protein
VQLALVSKTAGSIRLTRRSIGFRQFQHSQLQGMSCFDAFFDISVEKAIFLSNWRTSIRFRLSLHHEERLE